MRALEQPWRENLDMHFYANSNFPPVQLDVATILATATAVATGIGGGIIGGAKTLVAYLQKKDDLAAAERRAKEEECAAERRELTDKHERSIAALVSSMKEDREERRATYQAIMNMLQGEKGESGRSPKGGKL